MKCKLLILFLLSVMYGFSQTVKNDTAAAVYYFPNGQKSSEGTLVKGKPDAYWKTYYDNGLLKSEGNRKNFQLDSIWKFYDQNGNKSLQISYKDGKKEGDRITWLPGEVVFEHFENDIKSGLTRHFDDKQRLLKTIPFVKGLEEGTSFQYDTLGTITEIITYKRGYITGRDRINRRDPENRQHGPWKWFYEDGSLKQEGNFKNGLKNGIFKSFDRKGNLSIIEKFVDDIKQETAEEVARLELRKDYYPNGQVKVEATYKQGIPEGIRREFDEQGNVVQSYTFSKGNLVAQGIVTNEGLRQDRWKEYYPDGRTKSEGFYQKGKRSGEWMFYYPSGTLEQKGSYNTKGLAEGQWIWYYQNGKILRSENYRDGLRDGTMTEYSVDGQVIATGDFIQDKEEGFWIIQNGRLREEGDFSEGMLQGNWKHFNEQNKLVFEGSFVEDNPNGIHRWYYNDGTKREEGEYLMGRRNRTWKKWNEDGSMIIEIEYINGIERAYDGIKIEEEDVIIPEE